MDDDFGNERDPMSTQIGSAGGAVRSLLVLSPVLGLALLPLLVGNPVAAQTSGPTTPDRSPLEVIRERNRAVQEAVPAEDDSLDEATREELKDVLNGFIDFRELSRRSLGRHWEERTEAERREFVDVFRRLIRSSSVKKLGIYRADRVTYREPEISGNEAVVRTLAHKDDKEVEIVYHLHLSGGEWEAYDIVIDGASTVRTYRDSFNREISKTSYEAMYERLAEKAGEEQAGKTG